MIAIDLGSNTIRFIEFDGQLWLGSFEKIVRTAENLHQSKRIGQNAVERIIEAINEAKGYFDFTQPILGYTTAAMRLAENADEVLSTIKGSTGILFEIIDGEIEAFLTLNAVRYRLKRLDIEPSDFLLADIGGGSTELTRFTSSQTQTVSLNFGIVTLSESSENDLDTKIVEFKHALKNHIGSDATTLVLTAGTPTTIAAYVNGMDYESYDPEAINGYRLSLRDCYRVYHDLENMDESARIRFVGVGRENLIIAGILMVTAIYESMGVEEAIIIDDGLREGIALDYYKMS